MTDSTKSASVCKEEAKSIKMGYSETQYSQTTDLTATKREAERNAINYSTTQYSQATTKLDHEVNKSSRCTPTTFITTLRKEVQHFGKRVKKATQSMGLSIAVLFLVFLSGIIWVVGWEARQPYLKILLPHRFPSTTLTSSQMLTMGNAPVIKGTYLRGAEAVDRFRAHLSCFSESGKWVYDDTPRKLPWNHVGDPYANYCESRHLQSPGHVFGDEADEIAERGTGKWSVREELKWVWKTNSSCPWLQVDRDDFCEQLGPKTNVMVAGDSLNHLISWSLMNSLVTKHTKYAALDGNVRSIQGPYQMCGDIFGEENGFMVSFVRNDRLSPIVNANVDVVGNMYEFPWVDLLEEQHIKLLLLNRGAHYEEDEIFISALRKLFSLLSSRYPNMLIIYRNTQPGHRDCMNFTQPISKPQEDLPYHWGDFRRQNLLAKQIVEEFGYIYMDVYTMLVLRPEGHISPEDCLHYCIPGPLDLVGEYLYNILRFF